MDTVYLSAVLMVPSCNGKDMHMSTPEAGKKAWETRRRNEAERTAAALQLTPHQIRARKAVETRQRRAAENAATAVSKAKEGSLEARVERLEKIILSAGLAFAAQ